MQYNANGASYGGYFMKEDYRETEHSNRGHFLYVNFKTATNPDDSTIRYCRSILSHEFQHLLNANYFAFNPQFMNTARRAMDSWANELCSVTLECLLSRTGEASLHTHQLDFYIQQYKTLPGFINGSSEFLFKPMSREAYATRALFGCYLYSQIPTNRRDDFFKTLLNLTGEKDIHGKRHSSVEDLLLTLEACEYPAAGWKKMKPLPIYTSAFIQATQNNWHLVMRGFLTALCGKNPAFNAFLHEHSDCETMTPTCVTDGGQFPLHASGFLIAPTRIANLQSPYVSSATASNTILYKGCKYKTYPAYAVIFNGSLPSPTALNAATQQTLPNLLTLKSDALVQPPLEMLASKAKSAFDFPHHFDQGIEDIHEAMRFLEERAPIPGLGYPVNGQNEDGSCNTCFYIQR